jgi:hypothetical protein
LTTSELNAFQSNFNTLTIGQGNTNPVTWWYYPPSHTILAVYSDRRWHRNY